MMTPPRNKSGAELGGAELGDAELGGPSSPGADVLTPGGLVALPEYSHGTEALTRKTNVEVKAKPKTSVGSAALRSWTLFWINANSARLPDGSSPKLMPSTVALGVACTLWVTMVLFSAPFFVRLVGEMGVHLSGVNAWLLQPTIHVIAGVLMLTACAGRLSEAWHGLAAKVLFVMLLVHIMVVIVSMAVPLMTAVELLTQ